MCSSSSTTSRNLSVPASTSGGDSVALGVVPSSTTSRDLSVPASTSGGDSVALGVVPLKNNNT